MLEIIGQVIAILFVIAFYVGLGWLFHKYDCYMQDRYLRKQKQMITDALINARINK